MRSSDPPNDAVSAAPALAVAAAVAAVLAVAAGAAVAALEAEVLVRRTGRWLMDNMRSPGCRCGADRSRPPANTLPVPLLF